MIITEVAVAVFIKPDGTFLLSSRPAGKPYAGFWEFPGGKIEAGETVRDALVRELIEELNVTITNTAPWFTFMMRYTHAHVRLHCWRVMKWTGEMRGLEGQEFQWQSLNAMTVSPTLPGCVPIFKALLLPSVIAFKTVNQKLKDHYWRGFSAKSGCKHPPILEVIEFSELKAMRESGEATVAAGVAEFVETSSASAKLSASMANISARGVIVNSREELLRAADLQADFAVVRLCSVDSAPTRWQNFCATTIAAPLPCYVVGLAEEDDLSTAISHGAHGIAMLE